MSAGLDEPAPQVVQDVGSPTCAGSAAGGAAPLATGWQRLQRLRRPLVLVLLGLVALSAVVLFYEVVVVDLMHAQRHDHLVADFAVDRPGTPVGSAVAALQIPKLELNEIVIQGDSVENLRAGPAHRASTPLPGEKGNSVVLGHARRYGGPFAKLDKLAKGDEVFVKVRNQPAVKLVVASVERVGANDTDALGGSEDARLTLVTSAGGRLSTDRRVVVAVAAADQAPPTTSIGSSFNPVRPSPIFNSMVGLAYLAVAAAAVAFTWLRRRHGTLVTALAISPIVLLAAYAFALSVDFLLPATA